jgi:NADH-quinone oxidoreductase subunit K
MMITLGHYLSLGAMLFALSVIGIFLNRKNLIVLLMAIELMLLAVNMNFVAFSYFLGDMAGQIFVFFILTVAAAESAIGLALGWGPRLAQQRGSASCGQLALCTTCATSALGASGLWQSLNNASQAGPSSEKK